MGEIPVPHEYEFNERVKFSQGVAHDASIETIVLANVPGACKVIPAHKQNDRNGTDWWVEMQGGHWLSIDAKIRATDWAARDPDPKDDLALETFSVVEKQVIGWTRNPQKRTDYVLWYWVDTGRWCLISFPMLCQVFTDKWRQWTRQYQTARQFTPDRGYHSECVFVPRHEVWKQIYLRFGGARPSPPIEPVTMPTKQLGLFNERAAHDQ